MRAQRNSSVQLIPEESVARDGVVVADGFGIKLRVYRGALWVQDGIGTRRRERVFYRAISGLKRLVVIGRTGYASLEVFRWLADIKTAYVQLDTNGRVLATFGPPGTDRPALRRAQAMAPQDGRALELSKWLVDAKLEAQLATLNRFAAMLGTAEARTVVDSYRQLAVDANSLDELRASEAWAAGAYWQAFAPLRVRFARRDIDQVPSHWRTFRSRSSPIANGPRLAGNPANAVLNYLYALLEAEATLAARIVGLDPGLGLMHADQSFRDSLAADLMEPVRPLVDAYAFEILTTRPFGARDFREARTGQCRVSATLAHELAETCQRWGLLVGKVAEELGARLEPRGTNKRGSPTPITERRRAEGRPAGPKEGPVAVGMSELRACMGCGGPVRGKRKTCSPGCQELVRAPIREQFAATSSTRMAELHRTGHPARTPEANRKRAAKRHAHREAELEWERDRELPPADDFEELRPQLKGWSANRLAAKTGMSVAYWSRIKRGQGAPHRRWWTFVARLQAPSIDN
jgi:CRISPR-associated endonuclease Cas1